MSSPRLVLTERTTRCPTQTCTLRLWRDRITADLAALADAWAAPEAWDGMTQAGGQDLPGAMAGRIALDELVVHGWDIARASGQPFDCDAAALNEVESTVQQVRGGNDSEIPGLFGPVVP